MEGFVSKFSEFTTNPRFIPIHQNMVIFVLEGPNRGRVCSFGIHLLRRRFFCAFCGELRCPCHEDDDFSDLCLFLLRRSYWWKTTGVLLEVSRSIPKTIWKLFLVPWWCFIMNSLHRSPTRNKLAPNFHQVILLHLFLEISFEDGTYINIAVG